MHLLWLFLLFSWEIIFVLQNMSICLFQFTLIVFITDQIHRRLEGLLRRRHGILCKFSFLLVKTIHHISYELFLQFFANVPLTYFYQIILQSYKNE